MIVGKLRCPLCEGLFKKHDLVIMDYLNGLKHKACFEYYSLTDSIQDEGIYKEIINKYDFFQKI